MKLSAELWIAVPDVRLRYIVKHNELSKDGAIVRSASRVFSVNCRGRASYSHDPLFSEATEDAPKHFLKNHRMLDLEIELSCVLDWPENRLQLEGYDRYGVGMFHFENVEGAILSLYLPVSDQELLLRLVERKKKLEIEARLKWRIGSVFDVEDFLLQDAEA